MEQLPHNAMIVTETYRSIPNVTEYCTYCRRAFDITVFLVGIPSTTLNGQPTAPDYMMVCSHECALDYLQSFTPKPYQRSVCGIQGIDSQTHTLVLPSTVKERGWIYVYSETNTYPLDHPLRSGKWLVFLGEQTIDRYWQRIGNAVINGRMGDCAKVLSAGSAKRSDGRPPHYTICIYTYDYEDKADVMRIRQALRDCGILRPIRYKRDLDTSLLRYGSNYTPIYEE